MKDPGPYNLKINGASYYHNQMAKVYINQEFAGEMWFDQEVKIRELKLNTPLETGLVTIHLLFPKSYQPIVVEEGNNDVSWRAIKMEQVELEKLP